VVNAERRVLSRFEAERATRVNAKQPQILAQIFPFKNFRNVVFFARYIALRFRHHLSFEKITTKNLHEKENGRNS
jgi:hypothetical protein